MKTLTRASKIALFVSSVSLTVATAHAALIVRVTDSLGVQTFQLGSVSCPACTANSVVATAADADFSLNLQIATSNAPGGPAILTADEIVNSVAGSVANPNTLKVEISDTGFLLPVGVANLVQRGTTNEPAVGFATGTVSSTGYYGAGVAGNVPFCQAAGTCSSDTGTLSFGSFALNTQQDQSWPQSALP